jgi:hypothetical protein
MQDWGRQAKTPAIRMTIGPFKKVEALCLELVTKTAERG